MLPHARLKLPGKEETTQWREPPPLSIHEKPGQSAPPCVRSATKPNVDPAGLSAVSNQSLTVIVLLPSRCKTQSSVLSTWSLAIPVLLDASADLPTKPGTGSSKMVSQLSNANPTPSQPASQANNHALTSNPPPDANRSALERTPETQPSTTDSTFPVFTTPREACSVPSRR